MLDTLSARCHGRLEVDRPLVTYSARCGHSILQHIACEPPGRLRGRAARTRRGAPSRRARRGRTAPRLARVRRDRRDGRADVRERRRRAAVARLREGADRRGRSRGRPVLGSVSRRPAPGCLARSARVSRGRSRRSDSFRSRSLPKPTRTRCSPPPRMTSSPSSGTATRSIYPTGAVRLAGSPAYPNQAFRFERAYGVQFHLEVSGEMAREWAEVPEYVSSLERTLGSEGAPAFLAAIEEQGGRDARRRPGALRALARSRRARSGGRVARGSRARLHGDDAPSSPSPGRRTSRACANGSPARRGQAVEVSHYEEVDPERLARAEQHRLERLLGTVVGARSRGARPARGGRRRRPASGARDLCRDAAAGEVRRRHHRPVRKLGARLSPDPDPRRRGPPARTTVRSRRLPGSRPRDHGAAARISRARVEPRMRHPGDRRSRRDAGGGRSSTLRSSVPSTPRASRCCGASSRSSTRDRPPEAARRRARHRA